MGDKTKIEWTDATWNPVVGCTKVSPGCDHCYAERLVNGRIRNRYPGGFGEVVLHHDRLDQPFHWRKPRRVFVNSMSDLFHDQVPDEFIARMFAVMAAAPQHTFQVLTKRPGRMASLLKRGDFRAEVSVTRHIWPKASWDAQMAWPLRNVWLGTSVENQKWADVRVPKLLECPAAVRFLSCEPLLGPVDLGIAACDGRAAYGHGLTRTSVHAGDCCARAVGRLDWVIVGGESGPGARPMHPQWARDLRDQCQGSDVAFFMKQWGEWAPCDDVLAPGLRVLDEHGQLVPPGTPPPPGLCLERPHMWPWMRRVGKKHAGRELDGRTWDEYPRTLAPAR